VHAEGERNRIPVRAAVAQSQSPNSRVAVPSAVAVHGFVWVSVCVSSPPRVYCFLHCGSSLRDYVIRRKEVLHFTAHLSRKMSLARRENGRHRHLVDVHDHVTRGLENQDLKIRTGLAKERVKKMTQERESIEPDFEHIKRDLELLRKRNAILIKESLSEGKLIKQMKSRICAADAIDRKTREYKLIEASSASLINDDVPSIADISSKVKELSADVERHISCKATNGCPSLPSNTDRDNYELVRKIFLEQSEADARVIPEKEDNVFFEGPPHWYIKEKRDGESAIIIPPASKFALDTVPIGGELLDESVRMEHAQNLTNIYLSSLNHKLTESLSLLFSAAVVHPCWRRTTRTKRKTHRTRGVGKFSNRALCRKQLSDAKHQSRRATLHSARTDGSRLPVARELLCLHGFRTECFVSENKKCNKLTKIHNFTVAIVRRKRTFHEKRIACAITYTLDYLFKMYPHYKDTASQDGTYCAQRNFIRQFSNTLRAQILAHARKKRGKRVANTWVKLGHNLRFQKWFNVRIKHETTVLIHELRMIQSSTFFIYKTGCQKHPWELLLQRVA